MKKLRELLNKFSSTIEDYNTTNSIEKIINYINKQYEEVRG